MSSVFIILPNQLYEWNHIKFLPFNYSHVYIIEEPIFFFDPEYRPIKPNQIKIAYMRACMKCYTDFLLSKQIKIFYIDYNTIIQSKYHFITKHNLNIISMFETTDIILDAKYKKLFPNIKIQYLKSPNFLMTLDQLQTYNNSLDKKPTHSTFYKFVKNNLNILNGISNQDIYNRQAPPKNIPRRKIRYFKNCMYYQEAQQYTQKYFSSHIGDTNELRIYPITHKDAYKCLHVFLKSYIHNFGPYQDAVLSENPFMYHSVLSPMLNIGLLNPRNILNIVLKKQNIIPLNSFEGFVRQLIGWREYMRYLYIYHYNSSTNTKLNLANNTKYFTTNDWYTASTGILPLDNEIKKAIKYGYAHHIVRLMFFLNYFILSEIHPKQIYKWFMEVVAIDAYDWVMTSNIYAMGHFHTIGMRKPYLSTSNYILKMSNYKKDGIWNKTWTDLFYKFINNRKNDNYVSFYKFHLKKLKTTL